jgi:hypothetical protein
VLSFSVPPSLWNYLIALDIFSAHPCVHFEIRWRRRKRRKDKGTDGTETTAMARVGTLAARLLKNKVRYPCPSFLPSFLEFVFFLSPSFFLSFSWFIAKVLFVVLDCFAIVFDVPFSGETQFSNNRDLFSPGFDVDLEPSA